MPKFLLVASLLLLGAGGVRNELELDGQGRFAHNIMDDSTRAVDATSTKIDIKMRYAASVVYAAGKAAQDVGAEVIVDRKKAGDGTPMAGAGWVEPFLVDIEKGASPPRCVLFIDLGGGSITGYVHVMEAHTYVEGSAGEYKSTANPDITAFDLTPEDIYCRKNTFCDYSGKRGLELGKWATILVKHIHRAHDTMNCATESAPDDKSLADKVYIRQTGKIRYVELDEHANLGWGTLMKHILGKELGSTPFDYALLPSQKEALYEGVNFWGQGVVNKFMNAIERNPPAKNKLMLCQVGSSSTQASTCIRSTCDPTTIVAAGHGVLGALPSDEQAARDCKNGENCFPELVDRMKGVIAGAGIASLGDKPVIAILNAFGYAVGGLFTWCKKEFPADNALGAVCRGLKAKANDGEPMKPCGLMMLAASMGEFTSEECS